MFNLLNLKKYLNKNNYSQLCQICSVFKNINISAKNWSLRRLRQYRFEILSVGRTPDFEEEQVEIIPEVLGLVDVGLIFSFFLESL